MRESRIEDTSYRDLITVALMGFVIMTILLLTFLNPPANEDTPATDTGLRIEIAWPHDMDTDVDLWVQAPDDVPVGYSNLGGLIANLIRDDLGFHNDPGFSNHETIRTRGFVPGPYIVNVHLYNNRTSANSYGQVVDTVPVSVQVFREELGKRAQKLYSSRIELTFKGQELTAVRFSLDEIGYIVPDSIHFVPVKIRSAKGRGG